MFLYLWVFLCWCCRPISVSLTAFFGLSGVACSPAQWICSQLVFGWRLLPSVRLPPASLEFYSLWVFFCWCCRSISVVLWFYLIFLLVSLQNKMVVHPLQVLFLWLNASGAPRLFFPLSMIFLAEWWMPLTKAACWIHVLLKWETGCLFLIFPISTLYSIHT